MGLRWRLVAALVLVSGATLGVAALALLSPLENRLRRDELSALVNTAVSFRPQFDSLDRSDITELTPRFRAIVGDLQTRTHARVVVVGIVGATREPFYDTDPVDTSFADASAALARDAIVVGQQALGDESSARIAMPISLEDGGRFAVLLRKPLSDASAAVQTVTRAFVVAALAGLLAALLLGFGIATTLLRRLRRLRQAALALAEGGLASPTADPNATFDVTGRDEIGDLGRAFATMQERLRREEQSRHAFLATASHELRTPLSGLRGMLELLEEDLAAPKPDLEDARRQLSKAQEQSLRLTTLASDLLDLSRLDAGIDLRCEGLELGELSRAVAAEFEARAEVRRLELVIEPVAPRWATGDPGAVARILRILIDNALRFAPPGSAIEVIAGGDSQHARLAIVDDGPGVEPDQRERIFERFERGGTHAVGTGFGLGLAIGRELARAMGGELAIVECATGARFELELPGATPDQAWELPPAQPSAANGPPTRVARDPTQPA